MIKPLLSLFLISSIAGMAEETQREIFLLIGQSNMAGRAPLKLSDSKLLKGTELFNDKNQWVPACNPLNLYSTIRKDVKMQKLGIGYGFAKNYALRNPKVKIGLVVNARGGSKIEQWAKGKSYYQQTITRAKAAEASGGKVVGLLWHQGESNKDSKDYSAKLKTLVNNLRIDLGDKDLPIVIGEVKQGTAVNSQLKIAAKEISNIAITSSKGLKTYDQWHFDRKSSLRMGKRYSEAMIKLQKKK